MREIEVKARVMDVKKFEDALRVYEVTLSQPVKQHDRVYGQLGKKVDTWGSVWLRIRTENDDKHIFTLKRSVVGQMDSIEHETEIMNPDELVNIFREMHYEKYSDLTKIRRHAKVGKFNLCYDELPGLGVFVEAEKLVERETSHNLVVAELWNLLKRFGVTKADEVTDGYDVLERKTRGL
jgi:adenylate cyclase, class 2